MTALNLPPLKREATLSDIRSYILRLTEELGYITGVSDSDVADVEARAASERALFLAEQLSSLINMQSGEGSVSFGDLCICFGSFSVTSGSEKAVALPVSYSGDYFVSLTPVGSNCKGVNLYTIVKQKTGFTAAASGGTGSIAVDYVAAGHR